MTRALAAVALAAAVACGVKAPPRPPAPEKPKTTSPGATAVHPERSAADQAARSRGGPGDPPRSPPQ